MPRTVLYSDDGVTSIEVYDSRIAFLKSKGWTETPKANKPKASKSKITTTKKEEN